MKKRRIVFVVLYAVLIFINTIPIFIYRDKVQTAFSWLFLAVMLLELIYGIFCCVCKHKANFFRNYRRIHLFWKNGSREYKKADLKRKSLHSNQTPADILP